MILVAIQWFLMNDRLWCHEMILVLMQLMYATLSDFKNPPKQYILLALENKGAENTVASSPDANTRMSPYLNIGWRTKQETLSKYKSHLCHAMFGTDTSLYLLLLFSGLPQNYFYTSKLLSVMVFIFDDDDWARNWPDII